MTGIVPDPTGNRRSCRHEVSSDTYRGNHLASTLREGSMGRDEATLLSSAGRSRVTYGAFFDGVDRMATVLLESGLTPGERVAVQVEKSIEALQLYIATILAGGVFLPLNPGYTNAESAYFIQDASPAIFVTEADRLAELHPLARESGTRRVLTLLDGESSLAGLARSRARLQRAVSRKADTLAAILYTSGTTGRPKGAMLTHGNIASNARVLVRLWAFESDDVLIHALPIFHTHGLFVATNVALIAGCSMVFIPRFDIDAILEAMPTATSMMGVPTFYTRLLEQPELAAASRNMRLFISGSAPLLAKTFDRWHEVTGKAILERYGMSETSMLTSNPLDGERKRGTVGFPLPGVSLRIVDRDGREVETGMPGIIEVKGPNVFKGYWDMPDVTAADFSDDGYFSTGDFGKQGADGYVTIIGRARDIIITGGYNVYPVEVESVMDAVPGVRESAVIGVPHDDLGEAAVAVIEPEAGLDLDEVKATVAQRLARYKHPRTWHLVRSLPRNALGKVQKAALRRRFRNQFAGRG